MRELKEIFLNQFEDRWRVSLLEFGKKISESEADVLIFMARKAACLYHCLEDLKLTHSSAICTSDLILEGDLKWLKGKNIELIDDTLITGTTLYQATEKLRKVGVASLKITVFCVDKDNWCRKLIVPTEPYILAESPDVTNFSAQVVRALGVVPRPYLIDFPLFNFIRIPGFSLDTVLSATGWYLDEVTSITQRQAGAISMTMTPPARILRKLDNHLNWRLSEFAQLLKVRLYARRRGGSSSSYVHFCRVLPIVAFDPLTLPQLEYLWGVFERNLGRDLHKKIKSLKNSKERFRLLQCFCATQLFYFWFLDVKEACHPRNISFQMDFRQIDFCFPPLVRDAVVEILKCKGTGLLAGGPNFTENKPSHKSSEIGVSRFSCTDLPSIQAKLTEPFEKLFSNRELPARQLVKKYGTQVFRRSEYKDLIDRLNQGISLPDLREHLGNIKFAKIFISMFIDDAVDRGIAVPIIVDDGQYIYRAFRHGEDVKFTDIEARLIGLMLREFGKTLDLDPLPKLVVEKLIVLFIKGGLSHGFVERWVGNLGDRKAAGIRFYLHGAVAQLTPNPKPYHYSPSESLTQLLKDSGLLEVSEDGQYKVVKLPDRPPTTNSMERNAVALGAAIGCSLKGILKRKRDNELTLISTCLNPIDIISALAAEIHVFAQRWDLFSKILHNTSAIEDRARTLQSSEIFLAVNSGHWKWRKYRSGTPLKILKLWIDRLEKEPHSVFSTAVIHEAFPVLDISLNSKTVEDLINQAGEWLLNANIALRNLCIHLIELQSNTLSTNAERRIIELKKQIVILSKNRAYFPMDGSELNSQLELPLSRTLPEDNSDPWEELQKLTSSACSILDLVDAIITPFGKPKEFKIYRHILSIKFLAAEIDLKEVIEDRIRTALKRLINEAHNSTNSAHIYDVPNPQDIWEMDFVIAFEGQFSRSWLPRIIQEVFIITSGRIKSRICCWVELEPDEVVTRGEKASEVLARNLQIRFPCFYSQFSQQLSEDEVILLCSRGEEIISGMRKEFSRFLDSKFHSTDFRTIVLSEPHKRNYAMNILRKKPQSWGESPEVLPAPMTTKQQSSYIKKSTQPMHILHLSDLHFGTLEQADLWSSQLTQDLHQELNVPQLHALILSGDIANRSTPEEYAAAQKFLEKLCTSFKLRPDQIVIVPGNHDLDWATTNWKISDNVAYENKLRRQCNPQELKDEMFIEEGESIVWVRNEEKYRSRFSNFSTFYQNTTNCPYPLAYDQQYTLTPFPDHELLILGLNSAWELDHYFKERANIHPIALSNALDALHGSNYENYLKIAVWHHPLDSPWNDRIRDQSFMERLAVAGFKVFLHGHVHKADQNIYVYDTERSLQRICAGTFGAETKELQTGTSWQYHLLTLNQNQMMIRSRKRSSEEGAWEADACWRQGRGKPPSDSWSFKISG